MPFQETKANGITSIFLVAVVDSAGAEASGSLTTIDFVPVGAENASSFTAKVSSCSKFYCSC